MERVCLAAMLADAACECLQLTREMDVEVDRTPGHSHGFVLKNVAIRGCARRAIRISGVRSVAVPGGSGG